MNIIKIFYLLTLVSSLLYAEVSSHEINQESTGLLSLEELMQITIISELSTGTKLEEKYTPASLSIITSEQIRQSGARTFYEALEQVPGLHVYPAKGFTMKQGISIRGIQTITNPHVLIMLDGVALGTGYYGSPAMLFKMPSSMIEKIEVVRGPGSAIYGADAFSGVINITSKNYDSNEAQASLGYGSFYTKEAYTYLKTEVGDLKIGLSASVLQTDGDKDRFIKEDGLKGAPTSFAPGPLETRFKTLYAHADLHYKDFDINVMATKLYDAGTSSGAAQVLDPDGSIENKTFLLDFKHENTNLFKDTTIKTNIAFTRYEVNSDYNFFPTGVFFPSPAIAKIGVKEDNYFLNTRFIYVGINKHTLSLGLGYRYSGIRGISKESNFGVGVTNPGTLENLTGTQYTFMKEDVSRNNSFIFIQDEYIISSQWRLVSGLRYDYYDDFGSTVDPRFALIWQASNDLTFKSLYGRAFRAPTFTELYLRNNRFTLGNLELDPETIDTFEVIMNYRAVIHTKLNLFYYKARNLITYVNNVGSTTRTAQNQAGINGYGGELELSYDLNEKINLSGNYSYVQALYQDTKQRVEDIAPHQIFAQIQYKPSKNWKLNTQYYYFSKRYRTHIDSRNPSDAASLVNLSLSKNDILEGLDLSIAARNLFNSDYKEPSDGKIAEDYPMQGLNLFAELRYRF
ncbi:TonB-dependent receptor [Sulfurimonas sp. MAG313]|nr:TonB-dependent receptor [Sulfurimonas sp. MAG313]MDF1880380.1 TonB-dependent receptor [Sulfurimonas sp. MAG313]